MTDKEYWSPEELAMKKALNSIREDYPDFWKEFEEFTEESEPSKTVDFPERREEIAKPDLEKIRQRKFRRRLIVACFLGVCVLSTALAIFINSDTAHAVKFAMEKKYYQAKGWVQATDPDRVDDENVIVVTVTNETEVPKYKTFWDGLKILGYIPKGYVFGELFVEKYVSGDVVAVYTYYKGDEKLAILLENDCSKKNTQSWMQSKNIRNGEVEYCIWEDSSVGIRGMDVIFDDVIVSIGGNVTNEELIAIVNELQ